MVIDTAPGRIRDLACRLVETPSPNPPGDERAVVAVIQDALRERGLPTGEVLAASPQRPNVLATLDFGPGGRHLALCGHLDTKPVGDAAWSTDPLRATVDGDRLYGLGAADMKGALSAMVEAAARLAARPPAAGRLTLLLTADEEDGAAAGARYLAAQQAVCDLDAVCIGEPGGIDRDWDQLHLVSRGIARFTVEALGDQGHSSLAARSGAVNASVELARLLVAFADEFRPATPPGTIRGWEATVVGGVRLRGGVNYGVVPGHAAFDAEVRLVPGMSQADLKADLERFLSARTAANPRLRPRVIFDEPPTDWLPPAQVDPEDPLALAARAACRRALGTAPPDGVFPGTTDASWLQAGLGVPCLPALGPGLLRRAHGADEWVSLRALDHAADVYEALAREYCPTGATEDLFANHQGWTERSRVERPRAEELDTPKASPRPHGRSGSREHVNRSQEALQGRRPRGSQTDETRDGHQH